MKIIDLHKLKKACSNGLFAVVLLLSFFTFSGLVISAQTRQVKAETTCVVKADEGVVKCFQYRAQAARVWKRHSGQLLLFTTLNLSRIHTAEAAVSFKSHSQTILPSVFISTFYQAKTIPQNGESDSSLLLG